MEAKEFQFLFTKRIDGNSIIQLNDGKILFYYFKSYFDIYIYNNKTFHKLYEINLFDLIKEYKEKNKNDDNLNYEEKILKYYLFPDSINIKEKNDGLILIGFNKYLFN